MYIRNYFSKRMWLTALMLLGFFVLCIVLIGEAIMGDMMTDCVVDRLNAIERAISLDQRFAVGDYAAVTGSYCDRELGIMLIGADGCVLADSQGCVGVLTMKECPELQLASRNAFGTDLRLSNSKEYIYAAKQVSASGGLIYLRIAVPYFRTRFYTIGLITSFVGMLGLMMVIIFLLSRVIGADFAKPITVVSDRVLQVGSGKLIKSMPTNFVEFDQVLAKIDTIDADLTQAIEQHRCERQRLNLIFEHIAYGVIAMNASGDIELINNAATELLQFSHPLPINMGEVAGQSSTLSQLEQIRKSGIRQSRDIVSAEGKVLEVSFFPVEVEDITSIMLFHDVSAERKIEQKKRLYFRSASHELNTPLTSIIGYSEILASQVSGEAKGFATNINTQARRMSEIISDMLKLSELEEFVRDFDAELELDQIIMQVLAGYQTLIEQKQLVLKVDLCPMIVHAQVQPLVDIIANIIDNAIKFTNRGGQIEVSLQRKNGEGIFTVRDHGVGIPSHQLPRLFDRFFRADNSRNAPGTGLGLAIVKEICEKYNARITVDSPEGKGTEMKISFDN